MSNSTTPLLPRGASDLYTGPGKAPSSPSTGSKIISFVSTVFGIDSTPRKSPQASQVRVPRAFGRYL